MKKLISFAAIIVTCSSAFAQVDLKTAKEHIDVYAGAQKIDKKVLKDHAPQSLPYIALKFRTGSIEFLAEGKGKNVTKARAYALLDGLDSTFFQEITNEFAKIFTQKLTAAGVKFVDIAKIKESKLYKERLAEPVKDATHFNFKNTGTSDVYTANNELLWYYPVGGMKGVKFMGETEGGLSFLRLTLDFVEFDTEVSKSFGWDVNTVNFSAKAYPTIKLTSDHYQETGTFGMATSSNMGGGFAMSNPKNYFTTLFSQVKPIYVPYNGKIELYDDKIPKFSKNRGLFGGAVELGTFVIEPDRATYRKACLDALSRYADMIVEIIKSYNVEEK